MKPYSVVGSQWVNRIFSSWKHFVLCDRFLYYFALEVYNDWNLYAS